MLTGQLDKLRKEFEALAGSFGFAIDNIKAAWTTMQIVMADDETRDILVSFIKQYEDSLSSVQKAEITGQLAVELLLFILSFGAGSAASAASKSKRLGSAVSVFTKLIDKLKRSLLNTTRKGKVGQEQVDYAKKPDATLVPGKAANRTSVIQLINGKPPINSLFAGENFNFSIAKNPILKQRLTSMQPVAKIRRETRLAMLAVKYPEGVHFTKKGFPDFSPYVLKYDGELVEVDIKRLHPDPSGTQLDMQTANEAMKKKPLIGSNRTVTPGIILKIRPGYSWCRLIYTMLYVILVVEAQQTFR